MSAHITVPVMNVVSCCVDVPSGLLGVRNLCCVGDQMLNIPPRQLRTGARDMKQNIIKRILPSARVLHRLKPQRKHFNSDTLERNLQGARHGLQR